MTEISDNASEPTHLAQLSSSFTPTRSAAHARLADFLPRTGRHYASNRNADYGVEDRSNVSTLSPYIRHRLILEAEVLEAVLGRFTYSTTEKFVQEVFWRTYFKGFLEQHPSIWRDYRATVDRLHQQIQERGQLAERYTRAVEGRTGIECFDAWAAELIETGYLHNHTRMWFASIWIFTLNLPWQLGADFFYRHLMDGDPASNTLSWRWVGGLHTRGKTYLARPSNIANYTGGRFNPEGQLASSAPPLTEGERHHRVPIPAIGVFPETDYLLLITEEDCSPELLSLPRPPVAIVPLLCTADRSPMPIGERASAFAAGAVADASQRATELFGSCAAMACKQGPDWDAAIREAARSANVSHVVTAYAPQGPVAERLASARAQLAEDGITLHQVRRAFDDIAWPHAIRGFFGLKQKIPAILEELARQDAPRFL